MRPALLTFTPAALDANGLADNIDYSGGGYALTANDAGDNLAHIITILGNAATDHSGKTFTITGTDRNGVAQSETIAGPNGNVTVSSTKYFLTVTSVTVDATTGADTFDIGWTGVSFSYTYPLDWASSAAANLDVEVTGTINYTIQQTFANVLANVTASWSDISAYAGKTSQVVSTISLGATAIQLKVNSVTAGATISLYTDQPVRHY